MKRFMDQWYDENYWTEFQDQIDEIDELIIEFNQKVGLIVRQNGGTEQTRIKDEFIRSDACISTCCSNAFPARFRDRAGFRMVPNSISICPKDRLCGLSGFLPTRRVSEMGIQMY